MWTQTKLDQVSGFGAGSFGSVPLVGSSDAKLNNYELNGKFAVTPAWLLSGSYVYTDARFERSGTGQKGSFHQINLMSDYSLSKRTDVYLGAAYQNANGDANRAFIVGASGPADQDSQVLVTTGLRHRF